MKTTNRTAAHVLKQVLRQTGAAACLATLMTVAGAAGAQALPTAKGPGSNIEVGFGVSGFQNPYGQQNLLGPTVYASVNPHWRYGLVGEAHFLKYNSDNQTSLTTYMGGPKVQILRPGRWEPYGKFVVGMGHIVLPYKYAEGNFLAYAPGGGLEISLGDYIKFRAVDFEYQKWQDFPYGKLSPYGITTGFTFRLNPLHRYPDGRRGNGRIER